MNQAPTIFFQCDREGNWLHVDPAWHSLSGTSAANWLKAVHTSDRERVQQAWQTAVNQHSAFACTYRLASGSIHIDHRASPTEAGFIGALTLLPQADLLDLMFSQALDGLFLMLLDEPLVWHDGIDKEAALDYAFAHQQVTRVNQAMLDQYGAQEQDFLGKTPTDFFTHDMAQGRMKWREMFDQGRLKADTYEQRLDGSAMIIEGDYTCLYDPEGRILGHFGAQRDVTQQRTLEQQAKLERIMEATPNGIYIYDLRTNRNVYANARSSEILGYSHDEIMAQGSRVLSDNIHPDDWSRVAAHLQQCLSLRDGEVTEIEYRFRQGNGQWCWLLSRDVVFRRTPKGSVSQVLGVLQDMSDRKQLEQQLSENLARFEQLTHNVPALVYRYEIDAMGHKAFTCLSARAADLFGLPVEMYLANADLFWGAIMPEDAAQMAESCKEAQAKDIPWQAQFRLTTPAGEQKWLEGNSVFSPRPGGGVIFDGVMLDISQRKMAEQAYRTSETRLRQIVHNIPVFIYQYCLRSDGSSEYTYLGDNAALFFTDAAYLSSPDITWQLVHPDDRLRFLRSARRSVKDLSLWECEFRNCYPDGRVQWLSGYGIPQRLHNGDILWDCLLFDITERKQIDEQLALQLKLEQVLNRITKAIRQSLDLETIFAAATRQIARLWTLQFACIVQYKQDYWQTVHEFSDNPAEPSHLGEQIQDCDNPFAQRLKAQQFICISTNDISDPINQALAEALPGSWVLLPIVINGRTWGSYTLVVADPDYVWPADDIALAQTITNQLAIAIQQAELYEQLRILNSSLEVEVEQRTAELQTALDLADLQAQITEAVRSSLNEEHILQTVVDGLTLELGAVYSNVCLYCEGQPELCFTYSRDSRYPATTLLSPLEFDSVYASLRQGQSVYLSLDINQVWHTGFIVPVRDDQATLGDILVLRPRDVGFLPMEMQLIQQVAAQCAIALRQSRLYQAAQEQVKELQRLNYLKDDFLSTVSHELRTPMTSIKLAIQMLETRLGDLDVPPAIQTYLKILRDESDREIRLITDLLDMARLEAGNLELNLSEVDGCRLLERLIRAQSLRTEAQQQTVVLECMPHLLPITTDAVLLERIFAELLHNAVKYTPADNTITISLSVVAGQFAIAITNTGVSLPRQELSLIFDKFYRLTSTDQWRHGGTGLGLALVKQIVVALGGKIWANSTDNSTTFNVHLPLNYAAQLSEAP